MVALVAAYLVCSGCHPVASGAPASWEIPWSRMLRFLAMGLSGLSLMVSTCMLRTPRLRLNGPALLWLFFPAAFLALTLFAQSVAGAG